MTPSKHIADFCKKHGLTIEQFYGTETVGGPLYLRSLTSIPEGFNPTVGGYLYLGSLTSIPEGFNPTVGGGLYLGSGLKANKKQLPQGATLSWLGGKYISADGVFTEVISKKGNVYHVKKIGSDKITYLITNGKFNAHGETLKQAKEDLKYKIIQETLKNEPITLETEITIQHYRAITGACESGVRSWMQQNGITTEKIKASELLPILQKTNAYGLSQFTKLLK